MAKLHEIKKEPNEAILAFKRVLLQQPYHVQSLVGLALVEENVANGLHYLDIAEKFIRNE